VLQYAVAYPCTEYFDRHKTVKSTHIASLAAKITTRILLDYVINQNLKPHTLNPKFEVLNPKLSAFKPQSLIVSPQA
jgi:hypothetical protein